MGPIRTLLLVTVTLVVTSCGSSDEVARVPSPTLKLDAVLVETNGGATTSFGYLVYIVPRGKTPSQGVEAAFLYGATRNNQAYGANLKWVEGSRLVVEYRDAQRSELRRESVAIGADTVVVTLRGGVTDSTAAAGGMLFNLGRIRE